VAFLGVGVDVPGVPIPYTVSVVPAVASRVRSLPPVEVIAAAPPFRCHPLTWLQVGHRGL
jgi:hypothetical protein